MTSLDLLNSGEKGEIAQILSRGKDFILRLREMGILEGKLVEVLDKSGEGQVLIKVDNARFALGRGIAMKILIRRVG